jgi:hypothetical protein
MKSFVINFSPLAVSNEAVAAYLDSTGLVLNWRYEVPGMVFAVSNYSTDDLTFSIQKGFPGLLFIVSEFVTSNTNGRLSGESWLFLNNPKPSSYPSLLSGDGGLGSLPPPDKK